MNFEDSAWTFAFAIIVTVAIIGNVLVLWIVLGQSQTTQIEYLFSCGYRFGCYTPIILDPANHAPRELLILQKLFNHLITYFK
jgi:hypothetical protein